jgi:hypothetical protein
METTLPADEDPSCPLPFVGPASWHHRAPNRYRVPRHTELPPLTVRTATAPVSGPVRYVARPWPRAEASTVRWTVPATRTSHYLLSACTPGQQSRIRHDLSCAKCGDCQLLAISYQLSAISRGVEQSSSRAADDKTARRPDDKTMWSQRASCLPASSPPSPPSPSSRSSGCCHLCHSCAIRFRLSAISVSSTRANWRSCRPSLVSRLPSYPSSDDWRLTTCDLGAWPFSSVGSSRERGGRRRDRNQRRIRSKTRSWHWDCPRCR